MNARNIIGWVVVILITLLSGFWAFWGTIEAFHEGWWKPSFGGRLLQLSTYLGLTIVLTALAVTGLRWPKAGAALFVVAGAVIASFIAVDGAQFGWLISAMLTAAPVLMGSLFVYGRPTPKRVAYALVVGVPLFTVLVCGVEPVYRASTRFDDGDRGERLVKGNGVALLWAPAGPGWSREGNVTWERAVETTRYLTDDGLSLAELPQDIWRLPTREEIVRSLTRHDRNAGGTWDSGRQQPSYDLKPDKESPLWDPYAPLIYLWTSEEKDHDRAWIVVYHGGIYSKPKRLGSTSNGFRAVRDSPQTAVKPGQDSSLVDE